MSKDKLLVFVDCNVLIESFFVPLNASKAVAVMAANRHIDLITCALVVEDVEKEILERATERNTFEVIDAWAEFQAQIRLRHQADIPVLASAIEVGPDLILSDNTEHFNQKVAERCGIAIWSCVEFLTNIAAGTVRDKLKPPP